MSINESTNIQTKKMYRAKELAEYLGIGKSTVWLYAKENKIISYKISEKVTVFNIDEVEKALFGGAK